MAYKRSGISNKEIKEERQMKNIRNTSQEEAYAYYTQAIELVNKINGLINGRFVLRCYLAEVFGRNNGGVSKVTKFSDEIERRI